MRVLLAVLVAVVGGALTSFGQTGLPSPVASLANSSGSWCATAPVPAGGCAPTSLGLDSDSATSGVGVGSYQDGHTRGLPVTGIPITPAPPI